LHIPECTIMVAVREIFVAVCCSVLQCVAVCCSVLQCVAVCCSVLQCVAVCCSVLQCVEYMHFGMSIYVRAPYVSTHGP